MCERNDIKGSGHLLSFTFLILVGACNIPSFQAHQEVLKKGLCSDFFGGKVSDPGSNAEWKTFKGSCARCNALNPLKAWFYTKYLKTKGARLIHIDVGVVFRPCPKCPDNFVSLNITSSNPTGSDEKRKKSFEQLQFVQQINVVELEKLQTEHIEYIPAQGTAGISLVFLGMQSCLRVEEIKVSYFFCNKTFENGVPLPKTNSPANGTLRVDSSCSDNGKNPENKEVFGLCSSNGTWYVPFPCLCKEGFTLGSKGCHECEGDSYKKIVGNGPCRPCPLNSIKDDGATRCKCKQDFYRFIGDNDTEACHAIPLAVRDLSVVSTTASVVKLKWQPPENHGNMNDNVLYDVQCFKCSEKENCEERCSSSTKFFPSQLNISRSNVTISNLEPDTKYKFVIMSKNMNSYQIDKNKWKRVEKTIKTQAVPFADSGLSKGVYIGVPVVVVTLVIIIIVLIVILLKWRKVKRIRRASTRLKPSQEFPLIGEKNYIDPTTYDDPERAVNEFAKELHRDQITFESVLGGGEFGDVYKGTLKRVGEPPTKVAIKTLKPGSTRKNRKDFLLEASVMGQFKDLNVVSLEGVVTKSTPLLIVTEFMENGSLDDYLKSNDGLLKPLQLLGMARGVASGMAYLAGMHFVHRDLAARNVLVNVNFACKVADFGLSRDVGENDDSEYETQGGRIPVRWTAPEAIRYRKFSTASDVWSYGILLWEIMSFAERPYWDWGNLEVLERVDQGYRLPPPMNCPKTVHQLMMECWQTDRTKRPAFTDIVKILDEWIRSPEKLNEDKIKMRRSEPLDFSTFTTVKDWLEAFKMGMYATNFTKAGYKDLTDVANLSDQDLLNKVGVRLVGHRHKIYQRIKEMNEHIKISREHFSRDASVRI